MNVLSEHTNELSAFCKANKIKKLSLFGSHVNKQFNEESDVDLLIELEDNTKYGLLDLARMERELSDLLGAKVDLRTSNELSKYFRDKVVKEAQVQYEGK